MNKESMIKVEKEARKLLGLVKEAKVSEKVNGYYFYGSKLSGALRRSSMDLTRALAELRKPS